MNDRPRKRRGPIGVLVDEFRADPSGIIAWALVLLAISLLVARFFPEFISSAFQQARE